MIQGRHRRFSLASADFAAIFLIAALAANANNGSREAIDGYVLYELPCPHALLPAGIRKKRGIETRDIRPKAIKTIMKPLAESGLR